LAANLKSAIQQKDKPKYYLRLDDHLSVPTAAV
jgi:hypothetical protein